MTRLVWNVEAMSANLDQFLTSLKRLNDAGLINTLGVIATFVVAFLALAPPIWKWKKRPKLAVLLKPVTVDNIAGKIGMPPFGITPPGQPTTINIVGLQQTLPQITTSAGMLIQNTGASAALSVRCVVTDLYVSTGDLSFQWRDHPQETLSASDRDLPAGLALLVSLIGRKQIGEVDTGFLFGKVPQVAITTTVLGIQAVSPALGAGLPTERMLSELWYLPIMRLRQHT
jgi:hypothetical protein